MKYFLHKKKIGNIRHLQVTDEGISLVKELDNSCLALSDDNMLSIEELAHAIGNSDIPKLPNNIKSMIETIGLEENRAWSLYMSKESYFKLLKELTEWVSGIIQNPHMQHYYDVFREAQKLIQSLENSFFDTSADIDEQGSQKLESLGFFPNKIGALEPIKYSRMTATGRLKVSAGPKILQLDRKYRKYLKSRWKDGQLYQIDFTSLEPRTILAYNGTKCEGDIYKQVVDDLKLDKMPREKLKILVMSSLYSELNTKVAKNLENAQIQEKIRHYFKLNTLGRRLQADFAKNEYIETAFGRILKPQRADLAYLISWWTQSSGADVALLSFAKFLENIDHLRQKIKLVYIIHDALVIDVHPDVKIDEIKSIMKKSSYNEVLKQEFPFKIELFAK